MTPIDQCPCGHRYADHGRIEPWCLVPGCPCWRYGAQPKTPEKP